MSTYTRHRRRSWPQIGSRAAAGIVIGADAIWTIRTDNGLLHLATLALGVISAALILAVCSGAVSIGWHRGRQRYLVRAVACTPLRRPLYPINADDKHNPCEEVALHYATTAERWRHHDDRDQEAELDAAAGARPYLDAVAAAATSVGATQQAT